MARKKLHREPVLKDWAEVNDALRSIHEYEHALTEMGVDMSRRIDAVKAEYGMRIPPIGLTVIRLQIFPTITQRNKPMDDFCRLTAMVRR